jgi:hypothetical protein
MKTQDRRRLWFYRPLVRWTWHKSGGTFCPLVTGTPAGVGKPSIERFADSFNGELDKTGKFSFEGMHET